MALSFTHYRPDGQKLRRRSVKAGVAQLDKGPDIEASLMVPWSPKYRQLGHLTPETGGLQFF